MTFKTTPPSTSNSGRTAATFDITTFSNELMGSSSSTTPQQSEIIAIIDEVLDLLLDYDMQ
jgi:hypothetical protein